LGVATAEPSGALKTVANGRATAKGARDAPDEEQATTRRLRPAAAPEPRDIRSRRPYLLAALLNRDSLRSVVRRLTLLALDIFGVYAAIFSALALKELLRGEFVASQAFTTTNDFAPLACLVTVLLFATHGLYGRRESRSPNFTRIFGALFQATVISLIFALVSGEEFSSYYIFYGSLLLAGLYVSGLRLAYESATFRVLHDHGYSRRVILVGTGDQIERVARALEGSSRTSYEPIGFVSPKPRPENGLPSLGTLDDLPGLIAEHRADEVIIADPDFPEDRAVALIDVCDEHGVTVRIAPSTMEVLVQRAEFVSGEALPLFELRRPVFEGVDYALKRSFDLIVAALVVVLLSPLLLLVAILVRMTSDGPVLHRGMRPGVGEHLFACLKFRTMYAGAEQEQEQLESRNEKTGAIFKLRDDPRVTPLGRLLRRFSIDELPQLFNVLRGEMSLVGPRPLPVRDYERLEDWHRRRYLVLPGMTGLWQVSGRSDLGFDDLVRLDFLYIERWSPLLDVATLLRTIPAVLRRRGAY
jgi:exopolysaccharide biosynthesis polyprenyl glycosylphosphotransferase